MSRLKYSIELEECTLKNIIEISRYIDRLEAGLVILGREQKKRGKFGLPVRRLKQKIADRCKYSLLFIN